MKAAAVVVLGLLLIGAPSVLRSQIDAVIYMQDAEPSVADLAVGHFWYAPTSGALKLATAIKPNVWLTVNGSSQGEAIPVGSILMISSGSCPVGYAEVSSLADKTLLGTVAANGNIGTTGGADSITTAGTIAAPAFTGTQASLTHSGGAVPDHSYTPQGTNSAATFTGNALATHAHELPLQIVSGTSARLLPSATFGTGTSRAAGGQWAPTANTTSAAVALSQAVSAGTPSGAVSAATFTGTAATLTHSVTQASAHTYTPAGTVATPTFTGTPFDNRSAFVRVIFCRKT